MLIRLVTVAVFVVLTSAFGMRETLRTAGLESVLVATAALGLAVFLPSPALARFARLLRPLLIIVFAAPAVWMILQVIPMPVRALGNPIWSSASAALNEPLEARITVDIPATMLSLAQYCTVLATALVTAVIALDNRRAAHVLYMLVSITTLLAAVWIGRDLTGWYASASAEFSGGTTNASVAAVLGVLLSCAMAIGAIDQFGRLGRPRRFTAGTVFTLSAPVLSLSVCLAAIFSRASSTVIIAGLLGVGALLAVVALRKRFFGLWGTAGVSVATAGIVLLATFTVIPARSNADLAIALPMQNETATERMLRDIGPAGSGAGAFRALLPTYRDVGITTARERPTAAAAIAIGMGWVFLCGLIVVAVMGAFILFRRSMSRDQDYLYGAVGAGATVSLLIIAFAENGILDLGASLLIGALYGLACGQSISDNQADFPHSALGQDLTPLPARNIRIGDREYILHPSQGISAGGDVRDTRSGPALAASFDGRWARIALACLGVILLAQAAWMLSADWRLHDRVSGSLALSSRVLPEKTSRAIAISAGHGDLWTQSRSMFVAQADAEQSAASNQQKSIFPSAMIAASTLRHSPTRGDVWLMLAAISKQYKSAGYNTAALLRMSYYTAPNDLDLFPLRLSVALGTDAVVMDPELRDLIKRDVNLVVTRRPVLRPALTAAYQAASAEGKVFAENAISELDPNYLDNLRARRP